jgi:hypothetical protein
MIRKFIGDTGVPGPLIRVGTHKKELHSDLMTTLVLNWE